MIVIPALQARGVRGRYSVGRSFSLDNVTMF